MEDCKGSSTPMEAKPDFDTDETMEVITEQKPYKELVGCLMYIMLNTRPDLSAAVNHYSSFQSNATQQHWKGLKRILRYLKETMHYGLIYRRQQFAALIIYADSDWTESKDRKSTTGFLLEVFGNNVSWTTRKQTTVALSSTEAEYVALI